MTKQIYHDLREQLDQYGIGFPSTESGVELKILEKLYSVEEAEMYLCLSMMLETSDSVAKRMGRDEAGVAALLERMVDHGLIFRNRKGDTVKYGAAPFVVGSYEYHLKDMDREFAELFDQYLLEAFGKQSIGQMSPLRTIPVNKSIEHLWPTAPYEDVRKLFEGRESIAVGKCICRVQQGLLDQGCGKPLEVCFQFGSHAQFYVDKGMGRFITEEEALKIIDQCEEAGLVPQPFISQDAGGMCNCCGDCCGILRSIKMHPKPSERVLTNYYAEFNPDLCSGCATCVDRCQMEAVKINADDVASLDRDRCIGCGLCVSSCPSEAVSLRAKPASERREPPATAKEYIMQTAALRGKSLVPQTILKRLSS
jgi:Na+-translocating ferredoxin:NAD+ oxidoreductase subunit B